MKSTEESLHYGGLQPLFDKWSAVREENIHSGDSLFTCAGVRKFLLHLGFSEASVEVMDVLAPLIVKSAKGEKIILGQEYAAYAKGKSKDSLRTQLAYYIHKNYECVRANIKMEYGYNMGDSFYGTKNFIRKIGMLYAVYGV